MNTVRIKGQDVDYIIINLDNVTHIDVVRIAGRTPYLVTFKMFDGQRATTTLSNAGISEIEKLMKPKELL